MIFHNEEPWEKINNANDFDVPMGSYDGAEVCELVGIFLQSELSEVMEKLSYGLYRDDGLGVFRRLGKPDIERRKKAYHPDLQAPWIGHYHQGKSQNRTIS